MITEHDFKYCPKCGNNFNKVENYLVCENCGLQYYVNPRPTSGVLLKNDKGQLLLVERKHEPKKGYWDIPGGFININETAEDSVHREIQEELGIQIKDLKYLASASDVYEFGGIQAYTLCFFYEATMVNPEDIKPADDVASIKYFDTDKLPYNHFAFKSMKQILGLVYQ